MSSCAVLHVACHPVTGPWSVMRDLAQAQAASGLFAGVGVAVVVDDTWPDAYRQEIRNIPVTFYEAACPRTFGTAAFLYQRIRKPDFRTWIRDLATRSGTDRVIVHFHNAWLSGVFLPLPKVPGVRVGAVATFHGVNEHFEGKPVRRLIHRWMAQRLMKYGAALTSVDGLNTAVAERVFGIARSRFHVIPNGLAPVEESIGAAAPVTGAPLVVGHVGSIIPQKGWHILAEAAELLHREGLPVRVVLAGTGPEEESARAWAARHAEWAEYLGHVPDPRRRVMPRLDVLCLMSQWEGLPMCILEAMSVGLPVVATDVGGVTEAVLNGETGIIVPRTATALADALRGLHRDPERRRALGQKARARFMERFTLSVVTRQYARVYEEVLS